MDRVIVYPGSIPLDTDVLDTNRNAMLAFGALLAATLGLNPIADGLGVTPAVAGGLSIRIGPGSITGLQRIDLSAYGSLPAFPDVGLVKMAIQLGEQDLTLAPLAGSGLSQPVLVQASFAEADTQAVALPYYNVAAPSQPWLGPSNGGAAQPTRRVQTVIVALKPGAVVPAGQAADPVADPGWLALATITLTSGQTTLSQSDIRPASSRPGIPFKLGQLRPGVSRAQVFGASGQFVVPDDTSLVRVTVVGGGGGAGTHPSVPGGGGGAGGRAVGFLSGMAPGQAVSVTVGAGGTPMPGGGYGGWGGSSAFGPYMAATGGQGGAGGNGGAGVFAGGGGGFGLGGQLDLNGDSGADGIPIAGKGGDGGGPSGGRGTSSGNPGAVAAGPGGGGGGGGATAPSGGAAGAGGAGGAGIVIVEW